ncbi:cystein rich protein [Xylaria intraflava]|nr:cystein rich protein [Xylaria intraflava]
MKNLDAQLGLIALVLNAATVGAQDFIKNTATWEYKGDPKITGRTISFDDPHCNPEWVQSCGTSRTCHVGFAPVLMENKNYFACCAAGQRLLGSPETAFDCCADGHDLVGSADAGYHCCPTGFHYDGKICKSFCKNGQMLVDGKCVCPSGTTEAADGTCKPKSKCSSGLEYGKCYSFTGDNGNRLGLAGDNIYYAKPESISQRYGKFQFCADEQCMSTGPVNPSSAVYLRDLYGDLKTGANKGQWLNNAANGLHIGRTPAFATAGHFSLSKWPCGKYCLGGVTQGIGPACPADYPAMTFYPQDPQMCIEFVITEVPCDVKNDDNNCIWRSGEQCCNRIDCSA